VVAFGDNRRRDIDNILKSVADGCIGVLWQDDSQVHHMAVTRVFDGVPRTEVTVEVLP
jgi:Holliday junction resolvase RusA-like endonuclease